MTRSGDATHIHTHTRTHTQTSTFPRVQAEQSLWPLKSQCVQPGSSYGRQDPLIPSPSLFLSLTHTYTHTQTDTNTNSYIHHLTDTSSEQAREPQERIGLLLPSLTHSYHSPLYNKRNSYTTDRLYVKPWTVLIAYTVLQKCIPMSISVLIGMKK